MNWTINILELSQFMLILNLPIHGTLFHDLFSFLFKYLKLQTILLLLLASFLGAQLFTGSLTKYMRDKVMKNNANGYMLAKWTNKDAGISEDDVAISFNRSVSLYNFKAYFTDFTWFVDFNDERSKIYVDFFKI